MKIITEHEWKKLSDTEQRSFTGILNDNHPWDGGTAFFKNGKFHRLDGPAVKTIENDYYYIYGVKYSKSEWEKHPEVIKNSKEFQDVLEYKNI